MAYQSTSTTNWGTGNLVITKPSGLAVDDYMFALIGFTGTAPTTPSGWTMHRNISSGSGQMRFYYIKATSTEVAASNFTWVDGNGGSGLLGGGIIRVDGVATTSPISTAPGEGQTSTSTSVTFTTISVTPTVMESFLIYCVGIHKNTAGTLNCSNQAVQTSNPTWTEAFDLTDNANGKGLSMAYATRTEVTATGNATADSSAAPDNYMGIMCAVAMKVARTTTETVTVTDSTTKKPHKTTTETITVTDDLDSSKAIGWSNEDKHSSTWVNQDKN